MYSNCSLILWVHTPLIPIPSIVASSGSNYSQLSAGWRCSFDCRRTVLLTMMFEVSTTNGSHIMRSLLAVYYLVTTKRPTTASLTVLSPKAKNKETKAKCNSSSTNTSNGDASDLRLCKDWLYCRRCYGRRRTCGCT